MNPNDYIALKLVDIEEMENMNILTIGVEVKYKHVKFL